MSVRLSFIEMSRRGAGVCLIHQGVTERMMEHLTDVHMIRRTKRNGEIEGKWKGPLGREEGEGGIVPISQWRE